MHTSGQIWSWKCLAFQDAIIFCTVYLDFLFLHFCFYVSYSTPTDTVLDSVRIILMVNQIKSFLIFAAEL